MKNMNERGWWKVMLHMIALAKQNGIALAYHFAATDKEEFLKKRSELLKYFARLFGGDQYSCDKQRRNNFCRYSEYGTIFF